jgi:hypothetical protein
MTPLEQSQVVALQKAAIRPLLDSIIKSAARRYTAEMRKALKAGKVTEALKCAKLLARTGSQEAQQLLQMHAKRKK